MVLGDNRFIGVFDSGIGGLTVLKEIVSAMPKEKILYLGDTARVPYGSQSKSTIVQYTLEAGKFLTKLNIKALVLACNTASSVAFKELVTNVSFPVIGMVRASARLAAQKTKNKRVGIIGTKATIASCVYRKVLAELDGDIQVFSKACPLLVPLVEEGWFHNQITDAVVATYLTGLKQKKIDTLILGCTHYPLLSHSIAKFMGNNVALINGAPAVAEELKQLLAKKDMLGEEGPHLDFYLTSLPRELNRFISQMFPGGIIDGIIKVNLC